MTKMTFRKCDTTLNPTCHLYVVKDVKKNMLFERPVIPGTSF